MSVKLIQQKDFVTALGALVCGAFLMLVSCSGIYLTFPHDAMGDLAVGAPILVYLEQKGLPMLLASKIKFSEGMADAVLRDR